MISDSINGVCLKDSESFLHPEGCPGEKLDGVAVGQGCHTITSSQWPSTGEWGDAANWLARRWPYFEPEELS